MMLDRILALLALIGLGLFVATVPIFVPDADLIILSVGCMLLAGYDFWSQLFRRGKD
jgi:hypothetical protein